MNITGAFLDRLKKDQIHKIDERRLACKFLKTCSRQFPLDPVDGLGIVLHQIVDERWLQALAVVGFAEVSVEGYRSVDVEIVFEIVGIDRGPITHGKRQSRQGFC